MYKCVGSEAMDWDHDDDADTDAQEVCALNIADYFYDNGDLDFDFTAIGMNAAVKSLPNLADGVYGVELNPVAATFDTTRPPFPLSADEVTGGIAAHAYTDVTYEVMATDTEELWTTRTFTIRRNRRPVALPTSDQYPGDITLPTGSVFVAANGTVIVGTQGDGTVTMGKTDIMGDNYFRDDDSYDIEGNMDDYTVAYSEDGVKKTSVRGVEEPGAGVTTKLHIVAVDSGGLRSPLHTIDIVVDPAPTLHATNRVSDEIVVILEDAQDYTIPEMADYFSQRDHGSTDGPETLEYCVTSDNSFVAEPDGGTGTPPTGCTGTGLLEGALSLKLKAVGEATISVTATEADSGNIGTRQSAKLDFNLVVNPE
jgi:hypothetical protein